MSLNNGKNFTAPASAWILASLWFFLTVSTFLYSSFLIADTNAKLGSVVDLTIQLQEQVKILSTLVEEKNATIEALNIRLNQVEKSVYSNLVQMFIESKEGDIILSVLLCGGICLMFVLLTTSGKPKPLGPVM